MFYRNYFRDPVSVHATENQSVFNVTVDRIDQSLGNAVRSVGIVAWNQTVGTFDDVRFSFLQGLGEFGIDATVLDLTRFRGVAMTNAAKGIESKMVACLTPDVELINEIIAQVDAGYLAISNYNCPGQYVVAGEVKAIDQFKELAEGKIKRLIELNTSGPFHTSLLEKASLDLQGKFETVAFNENNIPVIMNTTGEPLVFGEVKDLLARQVKEPVQFEKTLNYLVSQGVDTFIEIGPNKTLSNFVKKVDRKLNTYSIVDQESLEKVIELWQTK